MHEHGFSRNTTSLRKIRKQVLKEVRKRIKKEFKPEAKAIITPKMIKIAVDKATFGFGIFDIAMAMRFSSAFCDKCGECCRICDPIIISNRDIMNIASFLEISYQTAIANYTKQLKDGRLSLRTSPCIFLEANRCRIYDARPLVCRQFPVTPVNGSIPYYNNCSFIKNLIVDKAKAFLLRSLMEKHNPELKAFGEYVKQVGRVLPSDFASQFSFANEIIDAAKLLSKQEKFENSKR